MYELNDFNSIQISIASPGKDQRVVSRRGKEAGNDQLQNLKAGKGRFVL